MIFLATASRWFMGGGWKVVAVVGGVIALFGSGWIARGHHEDARRLAEIRRGMAHANKASQALEKKNELTRIVFRNIERAVDKIVLSPVYSADCFTSDGVSVANAALASREPDKSLSDATNP